MDPSSPDGNQSPNHGVLTAFVRARKSETATGVVTDILVRPTGGDVQAESTVLLRPGQPQTGDGEEP